MSNTMPRTGGQFTGQVYDRTGNEILGGATSGSSVWGTITGTLASQTDLNTELQKSKSSLVLSYLAL